MNTRYYMVIIKGEIKTSEIMSCGYNRNTQKWDVKFNNGKTYSYAYLNVEKLTDPEVLNPNMYRISREGREFFEVNVIYVFRSGRESYWHICFGDGSERDYRRNDLHIIESCLAQSQSSNVFEYIKQIAGLSNLKNEETGEKLLSKKFDKISFVGSDVALAKYLNPSSLQGKRTEREYIPIFPFGCNNSQYKAVKNAMENQISVIQGPPGTGKTQTILNIIANILMQGKTVQIVSNNNSATENVYEKLSSPKYNLGFIAATLGSSKNKKLFVEHQDAAYPDFSSWKTGEDPSVLQKEIAEQSSQLKSVFAKQEKLACLRQELSQLVTEQEYFNQYVKESDVHTDSIKFKKKLSSKQWMVLWQECQLISEEKTAIGFWFKIKALFKYGVTDWSIYKQDISKIITTFQAMYYRAKQAELSAEIADIEKYSNSVNKNLLEDLCKQSMVVLKDKLARKYEGNSSRKTFSEDNLWKEPYDVLAEYPVILSTTFSSRNSLNSDVVYDYLIMDEASQVDIATGALALSCARNVVIVGDTKQLPNVVTDDIKAKAKAIFDSFNVSEGYQYTNSFLQSILDVMPNVTQTLLREHYRCHPKIINFCTESKIYSIFDYLYKQYTEERRGYLQKHKKVSEYDSENLMYSLIEDIISANKYSSLDVVCHFPLNMLIKNPELLNEQECQYAMNPATHLDFLIYNRIGKKPVLAIEVDGYEYHKEDTIQASRDLLKNHIMELYEIPLLRFKTNGSGEREKIVEMLDKSVG